MSSYVTQMASVFDGFRLDNAHSTPIHVAQYLLNVARSQNPNIFIMAELFTPRAEWDALYTRRLNINGLIREIQNKRNVHDIGAYFHEITCREAVLGKIEPRFEEFGGTTY
jgi:glycogen debranching enzyme